MSPSIEIYDAVFAQVQKHYQTYDHPPQLNEPVTYPFVVVDDSQSILTNYKTATGMRVTLTVHVWGSLTNVRLLLRWLMKLVVWGCKQFELTIILGKDDQMNKNNNY